MREEIKIPTEVLDEVVAMQKRFAELYDKYLVLAINSDYVQLGGNAMRGTFEEVGVSHRDDGFGEYNAEYKGLKFMGLKMEGE